MRFSNGDQDVRMSQAQGEPEMSRTLFAPANGRNEVRCAPGCKQVRPSPNECNPPARKSYFGGNFPRMAATVSLNRSVSSCGFDFGVYCCLATPRQINFPLLGSITSIASVSCS